MKNPVQTPRTITEKIKELCQKINPNAQPTYIAITPDLGCAALDCFACIKRRADQHGGRIQYGWSIWEWPRVYVEAEHHAVYEPAHGGRWLDITPSAYPEIMRRLFLPDDSATYDFESEGIRKDNVRLALNSDREIQEFFEAAAKRNEILNRVPGVGVVRLEDYDAAELEAVESRLTGLLLNLAMRYTTQNERCFCGSGQKFKRCHGAR
ncbi:MAG: SEC-C domain-containing protein [Terriglobia bacterium]